MGTLGFDDAEVMTSISLTTLPQIVAD